MNQESLISIPLQENTWMEVDEKLKHHNESKIQEQEICSLCFEQFQNNQKYKYSTIEQEYLVCQICWDTLEFFHISQKGSQILIHGSQYSNQIQINILNESKLYHIKKGICNICQEEEILIKINYCNHYCCDQCLYKYIQNFSHKFKLQCPNENCKYLVNDYLIIQFMTYKELINWNRFTFTQFCYNKKCNSYFTLQPYNDLEQKNIIQQQLQLIQIENIQIDSNDQNNCLNCKELFCNKCWSKHKGKCNYDKIFEQYKKDHKLISCPFCKVICEPNFCNYNDNLCGRFKTNWQQCGICNHYFCLTCKGNIELFETINNNEMLTCNKCRQKDKSFITLMRRCFKQLNFQMLIVFILYLTVLCVATLLAMGLILLFFGYSLIYQFQQVSKYIIVYSIDKLKKFNAGFLIAFSPIIFIIILTTIILVYVIGFIPLFIFNLKCLREIDY